MVVSTVPADLIFFLYNNVLMNDVTLLLSAIFIENLVPFGRVYVKIVDFCEKYLAKTSLVNLIEVDAVDVLDIDVVEDEVVFARVSIFRLDGHGYY